MYRKLIVGGVLLLILACQIVPTPPPLTPGPRDTDETLQGTSPGAVLSATPGIEPTPAGTLTTALPSPSAPAGLMPFPTPEQPGFSSIEPVDWQPDFDYRNTNEFPLKLEDISNSAVTSGLTIEQRSHLLDHGFVVIQSQEDQFGQIRRQVSVLYGQPYYLTTDAGYHALHLTYDELLKALEREELYPRMLNVTMAVYEEVSAMVPISRGTGLEEDSLLATVYMAVGLKLLDPEWSVDPEISPIVNEQLEQIMQAAGNDRSRAFPYFIDDYSAYRPVGHYTGDPILEAYFRAMTWFGRVHFKLSDPTPEFVPSRVPLLITLALRRAALDDGELAAQEWLDVHDALTFLIGPTDDLTPYEYALLMDQVYGQGASLLSLGDDPLWDTFKALVQQRPPPRIHSTFINSLDDLDAEIGWRFMGQRFSLDALIMQNLVYDRVGTPDKRRELPSGLDVAAALGSSAAAQVLEDTGVTEFQNYPEQMAKMQGVVRSLSVQQWLGTAYSAWMYAFLPQLDQKELEYPAYMNSEAWAYKDLNSVLGSWAELKHDTTLYVKAPESAGGGGPPASGPAPGYVEPAPNVFYRLAYVAAAIVDGLQNRGMVGNGNDDPTGLSRMMQGMLDLGDRLQRLGDIAVKELSGGELQESDYGLIQAPLGPAEERAWQSWFLSQFGAGEPQDMPPVPVASVVAGGVERVLHVGVGLVNRIYVVVNLNGEMQIFQGGVFSYYEFPQDRTDRLNDDVWRQVVNSGEIEQPEWTGKFLFSGGAPVDVLAFRIGDVYRITDDGAKLNVRQEPTLNSSVIQRLEPGEYVLLVDGPVEADSFTWWKLRMDLYGSETEGWAVENPGWYERAWGQ